MIRHPLTWLLFVLVIDTVCALTLIAVADARGHSRIFAFWAVLGFIGLVAGLLLMIALPGEPKPPAAPLQPSN